SRPFKRPPEHEHLLGVDIGHSVLAIVQGMPEGVRLRSLKGTDSASLWGNSAIAEIQCLQQRLEERGHGCYLPAVSQCRRAQLPIFRYSGQASDNILPVELIANDVADPSRERPVYAFFQYCH